MTGLVPLPSDWIRVIYLRDYRGGNEEVWLVRGSRNQGFAIEVMPVGQKMVGSLALEALPTLHSQARPQRFPR